MTASAPAANTHADTFGLSRRWAVPDGGTVTVDMRDEKVHPYIGLAWHGRPAARGDSMQVEVHMGDLDENGELHPEGWVRVVLPSGDDAITDHELGEGDVINAPFPAIRFRSVSGPGTARLRLLMSPQGVPVGR